MTVEVKGGRLLDQFRKTLAFDLDPFQVEAIEKLATHDGVLVSAPTSSGKTLIADYAVFEALEDGARAIYTTPLKALSNQKFRDLKARYGENWVGLVTGEHTINDMAPVLVMTTEILRNLIYEDPGRIADVRYVILDEVHYIDDFPRGAVWEEIMIQAPPHIKFVGLSATISNHQQVADWMASHRGNMGTVVSSRRPTELKLWLAMHNRLHPLFDEEGRIIKATWNRAQDETSLDQRLPRHRNLDSNNLIHVIEELARQGMLPAIYFIFSRRGCEEAAQRAEVHKLDLTNDEEKRAITDGLEAKMAQVSDKDEFDLYNGLLNRRLIERGVAVHHAGLLPFLKEIVEELFQKGLIKVVFATETLALGIHMPARGVVISAFTKFDGRGFPALSSGQLAQLMGRAGRRGIDTVGHGVILKDPEVDIGVIYEAAMGEDMVVESKFAPTYNMALNLLRHRSLEEAELLMERSFGQFQRQQAAEQRKRDLVNLEERLTDLENMFPPASKRERCSRDEVRRYFADEAELRELRGRLRRSKRDHWRGGNRGDMLTREEFNKLRQKVGELSARHEHSRVRRCPNLRLHREQQLEIFELRDEIRHAREEVERAMHGFKEHLRAIIAVLEEAGFLVGLHPSDKGLLASRIYSENSLLIAEAIAQRWLDDLDPAELCAVLVMLAAEDRGGRRFNRGGAADRQRFPTAAIGAVYRSLRSLHRRFSELEAHYGEETLRPLSRDHIDFAYGWASGVPLTAIPLRPDVDLGDGIKAVKSMYSILRQLEWAVPEESALRATVRTAMRAVERDLIRRV